jgi:DNA invertase Pin-like site-specific DNA recombinase
VVCVGKFDRFARSVSHLLRALETFNALGIAFVSLSERMDTTTPAGKMVCTVLGAVAELERSLIVERVKAGMRNAGANGNKLGRPRIAASAHRIALLRAGGASWATICHETGLSKGTHNERFIACPKGSGCPQRVLPRLVQPVETRLAQKSYLPAQNDLILGRD